MGAYLLGRLSQAVVAAIGVSLLVFGIVRLSGDPTLLLLGLEAGPEQHALLRHQLGLDDPLPVQYGRFVAGGLHGDLGRSIHWNQSASSLVLEHLPATAELALAAIALALLMGIPSGIAAAVWRGTLVDRLIFGASILGQSLPSFWISMVLILVFAVGLHLLPVGGQDSPQAVILPAVALSVSFTAAINRLTRSAMLTALASDYIRFARIKGVPPPGIVVGHALRNAAIPIVSLVGLELATLLGGAVVVETIFAWPGVGWLAVEAIFARDYPVVQAVTILTSITFILVNLSTDLLYGVLDPRIAVSGGEASG